MYAVPRVIAGSTMWIGDPHVATGNHPNLRANSQIRSGPRAMLGIDRPSMDTPIDV